ncbi:hypothetical protein ACFWUU_05635 [Kribbella sp. NPDC058693]|uniref:hypothetical protein n=1 Tax=Kribbella sp. NPDC058693 TaxID=3346602 RepID=UPI00364CEBFD
MTTHRTTTACRPPSRALTALTVSIAGIWLALAATAAPAIAVDQPAPTPSATVSNPGPPNYPNYDPQYEVLRAASVADHENGLDTTSVALGALGGIALAGAGLGITFGVQRRRNHAVT